MDILLLTERSTISSVDCTTKLYSENSLKSVFSTKTITVEFGCSKADRPKVLADLSADIVFAYTYMSKTHSVNSFVLYNAKQFFFVITKYSKPSSLPTLWANQLYYNQILQ